MIYDPRRSGIALLIFCKSTFQTFAPDGVILLHHGTPWRVASDRKSIYPVTRLLVTTFMIRLLALDMDGTLLNSRGLLSERNRLAIERARERGVQTALVTGRRFRDARPLALELGLDVPVIAHNGALTKHALTLETVEALLLPL